MTFLIFVLIGLDNFGLGLAHGSFVLEILYYCLEDWKLVLIELDSFVFVFTRLSILAMAFCRKVLTLLNFVKIKILHLLGLRHLPFATWAIKGMCHCLFTDVV